MLKRLRIPLGLAVAILLLSACGGGGGAGAPLGSVTITSPATAYALEDTPLRVIGTGFGAAGSTVTVRLTATAGTPFDGGTSDVLEIPGVADGPEQVVASLPATQVVDTTQVTVAVVLAGGDVLTSAGAIFEVVAQFFSTFGPATLDGSKPVPFTITGSGFHPSVSTQATVRFEPLAGTPFHSGAGLTPTLTTTATINSDSEITGLTPYAGVLGDTPVRVRVTLQNGTVFLSDTPVATFTQGVSGVQGNWVYESTPSTTTGLDYGATFERPIRGAKVQLLRAVSGTLITTRTLSPTGDYWIDYGVEEEVFVRVLAETGPGEPPLRVEDNTDGNALWSARGAPFFLSAGFQTKDYLTPTGWDGSAYSGPRVAAPFAVLDAAYGAAAAFLAVRDVSFPLCVINWSPDNRPEAGDKALGQIITSHWDASEIYVLGKEDVDTDEYDSHIIVHEWGHYFEDKLARSDSLGGPHAAGDQLEPSIAFGEGFGNALSAMILSPNTVYSDAYGLQQQSGFGFDLEDNSTDFNPGWFSETSVQCILFDLFDTVNEGAFDTVSLGLGPIYDVLVGAQTETPYLTTIFSFIDALKNENAGAVTGIDALCVHHGMKAILGPRGTNQVNDGALASNLPVYHYTPIGTSAHASSIYAGWGWNQVESNRQFYFTGNGQQVTVTVNTPAPPAATYWEHDIQVVIEKGGIEVGFVDDFWSGPETIVLPGTVNGGTYVIRVGDIWAEDVTYAVDVTVSSP